jgi:hypothetical protein
MAYRKDWGNSPNIGPQGFARTMKTLGRVVNVAAADYTAMPNTIGAFTLPPGFVVTSIICVSSAMAAIAFTVGDATVDNRYIATGVTGATNVTLNTPGLLFKNATETEVLIKVTAGSVAGTIGLWITGFIDN